MENVPGVGARPARLLVVVKPSPEDVVRAYGGQARTAELIAHLTAGRLRTAVAAGRLVRPRRGVYVLPLLPDPQVAAAQLHGVLSR